MRIVNVTRRIKSRKHAVSHAQFTLHSGTLLMIRLTLTIGKTWRFLLLLLPTTIHREERLQQHPRCRDQEQVSASKYTCSTLYNDNYYIGFHDCSTFGIIKKDVYHVASDFNFEFVSEIICNVPSSSGYLIKLTTSKGNDTRYIQRRSQVFEGGVAYY